MLGKLTETMTGLLSRVAKQSKLTEENIAQAVEEVRIALLEADVNFGVVKKFVERVKDKALGADVVKAVSPGQQFTKVVHDELVVLMGGEEKQLDLKGSPSVVMLCGLQGSGKTTTAAKLAKFFSKRGKRPLLVACDLQRPAAIKQLVTLGKQLSVPVFREEGATDPVAVAKRGVAAAKGQRCDVVIVDTAGRLHIDDALMMQLEQVKEVIQPDEVLFVANATTGQDAVTVAKEFHSRVAITGSILTMLDGNTRGGAAISITDVTGQPLLFEGTGEKSTDIQIFNPRSMADRILGMGDTINLVRKAEEHIDKEEAKELEEKFKTASFTYNDYLKQMQSFKKMGSLSSLMGMMPGMGALGNMKVDDKELGRIEAMIQSMTFAERNGLCELTVPRRRRIATGSGVKLEQVHRLVKSFEKLKDMAKQMSNPKKLEKMLGGMKLWR